MSTPAPVPKQNTAIRIHESFVAGIQKHPDLTAVGIYFLIACIAGLLVF